MQYTRLFADDTGESHFEDVAVKFQDMDYAPPSPPMGLSQMMPATQTGFLLASLDWKGEVWHPVAVKQFMVVVAGRFAATVSDGSRREFGMGEVLLVEDTHGKGHSTEVLADENVVVAVIQLE